MKKSPNVFSISRHLLWPWVCLLACMIVACGQDGDNSDIILAGTLQGTALTENPDKPVLVAVLPDDPDRPLATPALADVVLMVSADKTDYSFRLDLTEPGLAPGQSVNIVAFIDMNYAGGLPSLDAGDMVGFYIDAQTFSAAYELQPGLNDGGNLPINRKIYDHQASLQFRMAENLGVVPAAGDNVLVYAVHSQGLDLAARSVDTDYVVGMARVVVGQDGPPYPLDLLTAIYTGIAVSEDPFGLDDLRLVAILDNAPANGRPDAGEYLGFTLLAFDVADGIQEIPNRIIFPGDGFVLPSP
ncbi:MAG: hypothetical protein HY911_10045 [Desulfobacterales bacterium]|nr:hypothetical protein [Desulfobacterales bacterium]